jgi:TRAP-type C4-dicarboxylate transport system permease small subunit
MVLMPVGGALMLLAAIEALWRALVGAPPVHAGRDADEDPGEDPA